MSDVLALAKASEEAAHAVVVALEQTPEPPEPEPVETLVGSAAGGNAKPDFETYAARCGGLESIRSFLSPGKMPTSLSSTTAASSVGKRAIVLSFKGSSSSINTACDSVTSGKDDASIKGLARGLRDNPQGGYLIFRHEPDEENVNRSKWVAAQKHVRSLVNGVNAESGAKGVCYFGANFMSWSAYQVPSRLDGMYPGDGVWDFLSWDGYTQKFPFETGEAMFAKCVAWNKANGGGLPFAIGEFGANNIAKHEAEGKAFIESVCDYAKSQKAPWAIYWNTELEDKDYRLTTGQEKTLGAQG